MQTRKRAKDNSSSNAQVVRRWNELPREMRLEVLARARLPLKEWATLRALSRDFSCLLSDPLFATLYEAYDPPKPTLFFINSLRYDPYHDERNDMSRSYARSARESRYSFQHVDVTDKTSKWTCPLPGSPVLFLAASNDGFLCFLGHQESKQGIFVCNPINPSLWAILTIEYGGPISYRDCLIGIGFDRKLGAGKIVLCGRLESSEEITRTLIYNAKNDTWRKVSDIEDTLVAYKNDPFVFGGYFCWVVRSKRQGKKMVMLFNLENEAWEEPIFLDQQWSGPACLVELEKQLCLTWSNEIRILQVWKLDMDTRSFTWVKNVELPCQGYYGLYGFDFAFGADDVLYLGFQHSLWVCKMIDGNWHCTALYGTNLSKQGNWNFKVRLLKPSLFRFDGGGLFDSSGLMVVSS